MKDRTSNTRHDDAGSRYDDFTDIELDQAAVWLQNQGQRPWSCRHKVDGDSVAIDMRGVPPLLRQALKDWFTALELMDAGQIRQIIDGEVDDLVNMAHQVLTEHGR